MEKETSRRTVRGTRLVYERFQQEEEESGKKRLTAINNISGSKVATAKAKVGTDARWYL